jgi:hypothetical protein
MRPERLWHLIAALGAIALSALSIVASLAQGASLFA